MDISRRNLLKTTGATGAAMLFAGSTALRGSAFAAVAAPETSDVSFVGSSAAGSRRQMVHDALVPFQSRIAADIAGRNIRIRTDMALKFRHERLAKTHDFII